MPHRYASVPPPARDSLELASLASSDHELVSDRSSRPSISSSRKASLEADDPLDDSNPAATSVARSQHFHHPRSYSVSSTFDFAANLFPLSSTAEEGADGYAPIGAPTANGGRGATGPGPRGHATLEKYKTLTYLNGLSLIVGLIIGSGIFSAPSQVNKQVGSPGAGLLVWVIAGILVWTGAASYAELGGAIPLNGGAQVYLAKILGELAGFLFTWVAVLVLKPGSSAIIAIIMGEYVVRACVGAEAEELGPWFNKGVALVALFAVTFLNTISTRLGTRTNDLLMFLKFVALLGVAVIGIVVAATGYSFKKGAANVEWKKHEWFEGTSSDISAWAVALYAGLWAYDGWDNVSFCTYFEIYSFPSRGSSFGIPNCSVHSNDIICRQTTWSVNSAIQHEISLASSTLLCPSLSSHTVSLMSLTFSFSLWPPLTRPTRSPLCLVARYLALSAPLSSPSSSAPHASALLTPLFSPRRASST